MTKKERREDEQAYRELDRARLAEKILCETLNMGTSHYKQAQKFLAKYFKRLNRR